MPTKTNKDVAAKNVRVAVRKLENLQQEAKAYAALLDEIEATMYSWVRETKAGGWSTHQVQPQRELASRIRELRLSYAEEDKKD